MKLFFADNDIFAMGEILDSHARQLDNMLILSVRELVQTSSAVVT